MVPDKGPVAPLDPEVRAEIHPVLCTRNPIARVNSREAHMLTYVTAVSSVSGNIQISKTNKGIIPKRIMSGVVWSNVGGRRIIDGLFGLTSYKYVGSNPGKAFCYFSQELLSGNSCLTGGESQLSVFAKYSILHLLCCEF